METNINFIQAAISKDETRPSLTRVYNDCGQLVATDGYRLHLAPTPNGNRTEFRGFVDGYSGDFLDWKQALPKQTVQVARVLFDADGIKRLKAALPLVPCLNKRTKKKPAYCEVTSERQFIVTASDDHTSIRLSFDISADVADELKPVRFCLDLRYLVDALVPWGKDKLVPCVVHLDSRYTSGSYLYPILFEVYEHTALIMPMRD